MKTILIDTLIKTRYKEQWLMYLLLNMLFIWKYMSRTAYTPLIGIAVFLAIVGITVAIIKYINGKSEKTIQIFLVSIFICSAIFIAYLLYIVDPMTVKVYRWSATSYFLDGLFSGQYPYGIHTHLCDTNYPSPSPFWFYLNIPFWLCGDVGIGLPFYLLLLIISIYWFSKSVKQSLLFTSLLLISPTYWWEIVVRSDGFSNAIIIFVIILWFEKKQWSFENKWVIVSVICGIIAVTRLWAPIAPAIYLLPSFCKVSHKRKIFIIFIILLVMFFFFLPYIFWDTDNWIFFHRNPYMSETSTGNPWILLIMIIIAFVLALRCKFFNQYCRSTACFFTLFFLVSLCYNHLTYHSDISFFEDADFDISYLSLMLPYCLFLLSENKANVIKK